MTLAANELQLFEHSSDGDRFSGCFPLTYGMNTAVNGRSIVENRDVVPGHRRSAPKTGEGADPD